MKRLTLLIITSVLSISCGKMVFDQINDPFGTNELSDALIATGSADAYLTSATLRGSVDLNGVASNTYKLGFIYGQTSDISFKTQYLKSISVNEIEENKFSTQISSLKSDMTYYYRSYLSMNGIYYYGNVKSFKTVAPEAPDINDYLGEWSGHSANIKYAGHSLNRKDNYSISVTQKKKIITVTLPVFYPGAAGQFEIVQHETFNASISKDGIISATADDIGTTLTLNADGSITMNQYGYLDGCYFECTIVATRNTGK